MPVFKYQAQTREGKTIESTVDAVSLGQAMDVLSLSGLKVFKIDKINFDPNCLVKSLSRVDQFSIVLFTRRLTTMVKSGLALARALQILAEQEVNYKLKMILGAVGYDIRSGVSFSHALSKYPEVFSCLFVSMVKVGENTGELGSMLDKLGDFLERDFRFKKQALSATTYPACVLAFCVLMVGVIFLYILPGIMKIFIDMHQELPLPTKVVIFLVDAFKNPYVQLSIVVGLVYLAIFFKNELKTPEGRFRYDKFIIKTPLLGVMNRKLLAAHFCRALGIMLGAGIPIVRSIEILLEFMDNAYYKQVVIQSIFEELKSGKALADSVRESGFFPDMVSNMMVAGEATGELPTMLDKISIYYDTEITYALEGFLNTLEPIMVTVMGGVVCFVVVAVFMPLYQMMSGF